MIRIAEGDEAAWSPDGLRIVTNVEEPSSGGYHEELWVAEADGSGVPINILPPGCCSNGIVEDTLTWSPTARGSRSRTVRRIAGAS
jgi:hypothetical protein